MIALVGTGILLTAAYHGGELVYGLGVKFTPVHPYTRELMRNQTTQER